MAEARPLPAQTDRAWPSQPSRDLFDGTSVAAEGPLDTLFLGRRGSTTSSFMGSPSAPMEKFSADNVSLDGSLNGDKIEDTPLSNYFKQGRRLSNAVGEPATFSLLLILRMPYSQRCPKLSTDRSTPPSRLQSTRL